jgi:proteasome lid subunit RPN8/RPN11
MKHPHVKSALDAHAHEGRKARMKIKQSLIDSLFMYGRAEDPLEACGYISGSGDVASGIIPLENADASPTHFSFKPEDQFRAVKQARANHCSLIAVYHTHPVSPARMSEEDIRLANDVEMRYVICSLLDRSVRCFRVDEQKTVYEEPIEILPDMSANTRLADNSQTVNTGITQ